VRNTYKWIVYSHHCPMKYILESSSEKMGEQPDCMSLVLELQILLDFRIASR